MIELHPEILRKNGRNEFVVLPYEEFVALESILADAQDLLQLREAKRQEESEPGLSLESARRELGLE